MDASVISCRNAGGFVMKFRVENGANSDTSEWTDDYAIGNTKVIDLGSLGLTDGTEVWPEVKAEAGAKARGPRVTYQQGAPVANYIVSGTTGDINFKLENDAISASQETAASK